MNNKLYNFVNKVHVRTDYMGTFDKQWIAIGYEGYSKEDNNDKSCSYHSFDEVEELYNKGLTTENLVKVGDKFCLKYYNLSAITAFTIVNGIVPFIDKADDGLLKYAKKIGLVHDKPVPIKMHVGTKCLEVVNDDYIITYTVDKNNIIEHVNKEYLEKICVGSIKRLANRYSNYHHDGIVEKKYDFKCKSVEFNKDTLELKIVTTREYVVASSFIHSLRSLDMELFILNNKDEHHMVYLEAVMSMVRDMGQNHWINENFGEESEKKSNKYWFDKPLPNEVS